MRLRPPLDQQFERRKEAAVARRGRLRLRKLGDELARAHPAIEDPEAAIRRGIVVVDGRVALNPGSLVRAGASITLRGDQPLRGTAKLNVALAAFRVDVRGRVALDVGAAGGFTRTLLDLGGNLDRTNLGRLDEQLVPEPVELVTFDLSYLALARAVPQLSRLHLAHGCELIALVKPQYELGLAAPPTDGRTLEQALGRASTGIAAAGWTLASSIRSPLRGGRGAVEFFIHARKEQ